MGKTGRREVRGRRKHGYKLHEIARATEKPCEISSGHLRDKQHEKNLWLGRRVMSVAAKEYSYKGQEIAEYLWRDPSVITRYLKEGNELADEAEKVHPILQHIRNKQVSPRVVLSPIKNRPT